MNLVDYVKKYGKYDFNALKFNELDGIVFSAISYIRFEEVIKKKSIKIDEIISTFEAFDKKTREKYFMYEDDEKLLSALKCSDRFRRLSIIDICSYYNKKATTQFFAYAVRLNDGEVAVAYRGTDTTILGWYESLKLGFDDYVGGQERSKDFLKKLITEYPDDTFHIVGHSKGGNYAIYAASSLSKDLQSHIDLIYNYDGPSLLLKTKKRTNYFNIKSKITTFIPCDSVVGIVLGNDAKTKVVDSKFVSFAQHVYYFWNVVGTKFKVGKRRTIASNAFEETFPKWASSIPDDEIRVYIKTLYEWLTKAKIREVVDFVNIEKIMKLIHIINSEKDEGKLKFGEEIIGFIKIFIDSIVLKIIKGNI